MSNQILNTKLTDRPVIALLGMPSGATGLVSSAALPVMPTRVRSERPTEASAVAAAATAKARAFSCAAAAATGAGTGAVGGEAGANGYAHGQQKTQQFGKWAFRGLEPWSDPA